MSKKLTAKEKMILRAEEAAKKKEKAEKKNEIPVASVTVTEAKSNIILLENNFNLTFCEDTNLNDFLNEKGSELYSNEVNTNLEAGKILTDVFDELSGSNQHDSLYNTWLGAMEYNARTALRHRIRYHLFKTATTKESKELFATLPVRLLDKLNVHKEKEHFIALINNLDIKSKAELASFMESGDIKEVNEKIKPFTPFYKPIFSYEKTIKKLTSQERYKVKEEIKAVSKEARRLEKIIDALDEEAALENNMKLTD